MPSGTNSNTVSEMSARMGCTDRVDGGTAVTVSLVEVFAGMVEEWGMFLLEELTVVLLLQVLDVLSRRGRLNSEKMEEGWEEGWLMASLEP